LFLEKVNINPKGRLIFLFEPFFNTIIKPNSNIEVGNNFMLAETVAGNAACYLHRGIDCIELFDYPLDAMEILKQEISMLRNNGYDRLSFHTPMPRPASFTETGVACYYLHEDPGMRQLSFDLLKHTFQHAWLWQADFIVTHLTYGKTDTKDSFIAVQLAQQACERIAAMSRDYGIPVNVEFAAYTSSFNQARQFIDVVSQQPELGICIDTGHAMLGARLNNRDYFDDVITLAPYTRSMHLWNTLGDTSEHIPLHPSQTPDLGWIDLEGTLEIVLARNPDVDIVFEYPVMEVDHDIQSGYDWIRDTVKKIIRLQKTK